VATRLQEAKAAFFENDSLWIEKLNHAMTAQPNNLTNWRATQPLMSWCRAEPENASLAFRFLWNTDDRVQQRFDQFVEVVSNAGQRIYIAETSFFHMAVDPLAFPMHRAMAVERAMDLTGYPEPKEVGIKSGETGRRYEHFLTFLDIMIKRASERNILFRDRLDAQGASWTVTQWALTRNGQNQTSRRSWSIRAKRNFGKNRGRRKRPHELPSSRLQVSRITSGSRSDRVHQGRSGFPQPR